jgi:hypothetical protein
MMRLDIGWATDPDLPYLHTPAEECSKHRRQQSQQRSGWRGSKIEADGNPALSSERPRWITKNDSEFIGWLCSLCCLLFNYKDSA